MGGYYSHICGDGKIFLAPVLRDSREVLTTDEVLSFEGNELLNSEMDEALHLLKDGRATLHSLDLFLSHKKYARETTTFLQAAGQYYYEPQITSELPREKQW